MHLIPQDFNERVCLMGHHHLCAGAFSSVVIIMFGKFADQYGLSQTLLILTSGFWAIAFCVTPLYFLVYPKDSESLHSQMQERCKIISGE